jgi:hypothetical protein
MAAVTETCNMQNLAFEEGCREYETELIVDTQDKDGTSTEASTPRTMTIEEAIIHYGSKFGKTAVDEDALGFKRQAFPWRDGAQTTQADEEAIQDDVALAFKRAMEEPSDLKASPIVETRKRYQFPVAQSMNENREEDSDGEQVWICKACQLPLGDIRYKSDGSTCVSDSLHGECMAQAMVAKLQKEDATKTENDRKEKQERHEAYGIGWNIDCVPRNGDAASKLAMRDVPDGLNCLVLDEATRSIRIASTLEPATAVNLEYLSTALKVRRKEGHEPIFSLDPVSTEKHPVHDKHTMQQKNFEPEWLAGTSVGEVLFQADYHLKELSMGEYGQPVVGMKSCFDISFFEETSEEWAAREWFLVRKAEMQISEGNALIPYVKMAWRLGSRSPQRKAWRINSLLVQIIPWSSTPRPLLKTST